MVVVGAGNSGVFSVGVFTVDGRRRRFGMVEEVDHGGSWMPRRWKRLEIHLNLQTRSLNALSMTVQMTAASMGVRTCLGNTETAAVLSDGETRTHGPSRACRCGSDVHEAKLLGGLAV